MKYSRAALIHFLFIAATVTGFASISIADTVTLTDGTVFKGDILTDTKTEVTMNCKVGKTYEVKKFARSKIKSVVDDAPKVSGSGEPKTPPTSTGSTTGGTASGGTSSKKLPSGAGTDPAPSKSSDAAKAADAAKAEAVVDSDSLSARIKTMRESKTSAAEMLQAVFEGFPENVLKYEVTEGPTQVKLTDKAAAEAAAEGDVIVQVKVDIEIDKQKYAIWCKGAKEGLSAIATETKTISWNPKKGGAVKISKKSASGGATSDGSSSHYPGHEFVETFGRFMSKETAKAEHLLLERGSWSQFSDQIKKLSTSVSSGNSSKDEESLHDGEVIQKGLFFVCLLSSAESSVDVFGIPFDVMKTLDPIKRAPLIASALLTETGEIIASTVHPTGDPIVFEKETSQEMAMLRKGDSSWSASPITTPHHLDENPGMLLIAPFSNGVIGNQYYFFSSRISIPVWFSIAQKDLPNCKVSITLGDRVLKDPPAELLTDESGSEGALSWAEVLEQNPDPTFVTDAEFLKRITETKLPWRVRDKKTGIEMLLVPPGEFVMGSSRDDKEALDNERPAHEVTITKAFYLGRTEVTQSQWATVMKSNPRGVVKSKVIEILIAQGFTKKEATNQADVYVEAENTKRASCPVWGMAWTDCVNFCAKTGMTLPTEAQWEYACRGGDRTPRYGPLDDIAHYKADDEVGRQEGSEASRWPSPVGSKQPNALGFYDMIGNVGEMCKDKFDNKFYQSCADGVVDPICKTAKKEPGVTEGYVVRGGECDGREVEFRASSRSSHKVSEKDNQAKRNDGGGGSGKKSGEKNGPLKKGGGAGKHDLVPSQLISDDEGDIEARFSRHGFRAVRAP